MGVAHVVAELDAPGVVLLLEAVGVALRLRVEHVGGGVEGVIGQVEAERLARVVERPRPLERALVEGPLAALGREVGPLPEGARQLGVDRHLGAQRLRQAVHIVLGRRLASEKKNGD